MANPAHYARPSKASHPSFTSLLMMRQLSADKTKPDSNTEVQASSLIIELPLGSASTALWDCGVMLEPFSFAYSDLSSGPLSIFSTFPVQRVQSTISLQAYVSLAQDTRSNSKSKVGGKERRSYIPKSSFSNSAILFPAFADCAKLMNSIVIMPFSSACIESAVFWISALSFSSPLHSPFVKT
jgi:hypothetical protein